MSISYVAGAPIEAGNFPVSIGAITTSVGDLLVMHVYVFSAGSNLGTLTFTDNLNTGAWSNLGALYDGSATTRQYYCSYIVCNAAGSSPTVSCAALNSQLVYVFVAQYTGFLGTATASGDFTQVYQDTAATAVAGTSFNTSKVNELVCAFGGSYGSQSWATAPSGWTQRGFFHGDVYLYDKIVSASGTAEQLTGTLSTADGFYVTQAGFYDASASAPPNTAIISWLV